MKDYDFTYYYTVIPWKQLVSDVREVCIPLIPEIINKTKTTAEDSQSIGIGDWPELVELREKYRFIGKNAVLIVGPPNQLKPIHTDSWERPLSFNIGLLGTSQNNRTNFYSFDSMQEVYRTTDGDVYLKLKDIDTRENRDKHVLASYTLMDDPVMCHTMVPHEVMSTSTTETRYSMCFSIKLKEHTQENIYEIVNKLQAAAKKSNMLNA